MESTASEIDHRSQLLQEDNGQLHGNLQQLKDDLQKMTLHYNACRNELNSKVQELDLLQASNAKEEELSKQLIDKIREMEDLVYAKEQELELKDKEIQRITQELLEQQLLCDSMVSTEVLLCHMNVQMLYLVYEARLITVCD